MQNVNNRPSPIKTIAKVAVGTGIAAGTVLLLARTGKLDKFEGGNKYVEDGKTFLKKYADPANAFIDQKATALKATANEVIAKSPKLTEAKGKVLEIAENIKEIDLVKIYATTVENAGTFLKGAKAKVVDFVGQFVKKAE